MITPDQVRQWARLARLDLPDPELERLQGDLDKILEFVRALQDVPVESGSVPDSVSESERGNHPLPSVERPDEVAPPLSREVALEEARSTSDGHFAVPAVVESEAQYERRTGSAGGDSNENTVLREDSDSREPGSSGDSNL